MIKTKKLIKIIPLLMLCCWCVSLAIHPNANAWWGTGTGKKGKYQCFAVEYQVKVIDQTPYSYSDHGDTVNVDWSQAGTYSTNMVCAWIDDDGKVQGDLVIKDKKPQSVDHMFSKRPGFRYRNGVLYLDYCETATSCPEPKSFKTSDYNTFEEFATVVNRSAPLSIPGMDATKLDLKLNKTSADVREEIEEEREGVEPGAIEQTCENMGGAQSLGWIICPIITLTGEAANGLYNTFVEPALQVEPKLFTDSDSSVEAAWGTFQNIANIIFVILLLAVIFSQLTGVGIDNYGIKKILPKLIIAAILINLSYLLCLVAVDLSNILGNAFQALFDSLEMGLNPTVTVDGSTLSGVSLTGGEVASTGITALVTIGLLIAMRGEIWQSPTIALALFVATIGVAVSIFFLFILLAAREAAIIVLTVISPVAVVCYMLPNTKKLFDKWLSAFKGLLLVYPIAGLLVGGGNYVSTLLLSSGMNDGFFTALTATITGVIPIFFIPMVLRNSFNALGNIGARIAGFGDRMRGGVTGAVRNSQGYRNMQDRARMWSNRQQAGANIENMNGFQRFMRGGRRSVGAARMRHVKDLKDYGDLETMMSDEGFRAAVAKAGADSYEQDLDQGVTLFRQNGIYGQQYGLPSIENRLKQLSEMKELNAEQHREVAILARAAIGEKGGGGAVGRTLRSDKTSNAFKMAMGDALQKDSTLRAKLSEKDAAAAIYGESFMENGSNRNGPPSTFEQYRDANKEEIMKRANSYEIGLNQSALARDEYLNNLQESDLRRIVNDEKFLNSLAKDDRDAVLKHAKTKYNIQDPYGGNSNETVVNDGGPAGADGMGD